MNEKELSTKLHAAMSLGFTFGLLISVLAWKVAPDYAGWIMVPAVLLSYVMSWYVARALARMEFPSKKTDDAS